MGGRSGELIWVVIGVPTGDSFFLTLPSVLVVFYYVVVVTG
jgi:hypothetical protein